MWKCKQVKILVNVRSNTGEVLRVYALSSSGTIIRNVKNNKGMLRGR